MSKRFRNVANTKIADRLFDHLARAARVEGKPVRAATSDLTAIEPLPSGA
jgi:hypothetical protein